MSRMEKLTLKELAPYLPYQLQVVYFFDSGDILKGEITGTTLETSNKVNPIIIKYFNELYDTPDFIHLEFKDVKPLLRPISDLEKFSPVIWEYSYLANKKSIYQMQYLEVQFLFENHFDVFGLIEKGLAININSIDA